MNQNYNRDLSSRIESEEEKRANLYQIVKPLREGIEDEEKIIVTRLFYAAGLIDQDVINKSPFIANINKQISELKQSGNTVSGLMIL